MHYNPKIHPNNTEVREWAQARFYGVGDTGRLPLWVIEAWDARHPKRKYVAEVAHHGTLHGYARHGCRERCCATVWHDYWQGYHHGGSQAA